MTFKHSWRRTSMWTLFIGWLLLQPLLMLQVMRADKSPVDFLSYERAAQALTTQTNPFGDTAASAATWQLFHVREQELLQASDPPSRRSIQARHANEPQHPGPYIYPPSLALFLGFLGVNGLMFGIITLIAVGLFAWLWLKTTKHHPAWLLLIIGSVEVFSTLHGGNVELILLCLTLSSALLLWRHRGLLAAPVITFVLLIKPFYILFFLVFAAFQYTAQQHKRQTARTVLAAGIGSLVLIGLEFLHWGAPLRNQTLAYLSQAFDYQWFALPINEQTPMSIWNRTPLQWFVSSGLPLMMAQWIAGGVWLVCFLIALWACRGKQLPFPIVFALALTLVYIGRPIGWTLIYLDLVLLTALWPVLSRRMKHGLLAVSIGVLISRWWAFFATLQGESMQLMTTQHPTFPWETIVLLFGSWLLLVWYCTRTFVHAPVAPEQAT
jgi:hypothetical protein